MTERDKLWVDPRLIDLAIIEASRLKRTFRLDSTDAKEVYRTIMDVAVRYTLARAVGERAADKDGT